MIYVTSDSHFGHENIIRYCLGSRPFKSVEEMNRHLISCWNNVVRPEDEVIHCGDFFVGCHEKQIGPILAQLNGKITLVRGNHDSKSRIEKYKNNFGIEVKDIHYCSYKGRFFIFCHFPIANEEFMRMVREDNSEVILCYGHIHDQAPRGLVDGTFHVGVDTNNLTPVSLEYIWRCSRDEEDKRDVPKVEDKICISCSKFNNSCKGQDGGCEFYKKGM